MKLDNKESLNAGELGDLILGMRAAYARGENAMEYARRTLGMRSNMAIASMIAYDLQAGSYIQGALEDPEGKAQWCRQLADILNPYVTEGGTLLEVGCGEATTLAGVMQGLGQAPHALGFDISWSRCAHGLTWLAQKTIKADLFVADLFNIPLEDSSVDVVYTSHSLEPNGGREKAAIRELMRVARRAVVLIEPIFELANPEARARMESHGYVRALKQSAEDLGAKVSDYRLLDYCVNPLNPSGVVLIEKDDVTGLSHDLDIQWKCPVTSAPLVRQNTAFYAPTTGIVFPILSRIPLLQPAYAVVASSFGALGADKLSLD
jgi:ubiquinone/menaquinone biosynthesis C-methylase UbiE